MSEARKTPQSHFTGPVVIDPLTRIEGHLRIEVEVKDGRVSEARSVGTLYRGLETILVGRDPRDVQHFTQRTCGVCTYTHALASTRALEDAIKVEIPKNATYIRNLVLGMQYLHDHIVHFYHLHALDFVDVTSVPTRFSGFGGQPPMLMALMPFAPKHSLTPIAPVGLGLAACTPPNAAQVP